MGGTPDKNTVSLCGQRPLGHIVYPEAIVAEAGDSDALKITDSADGYVYVPRIVGGKEDCCDCNNHSSEITVECGLWEPRGKYIITNKGGNRGMTYIGKVRGHGTEVDVDLGNISDQSDDVNGVTKLRLEHELGPQEAITVRALGSPRPIILNPEQRYEIIFEIPGPFKSLFLKAYKQLKKWLNPLGVPL